MHSSRRQRRSGLSRRCSYRRWTGKTVICRLVLPLCLIPRREEGDHQSSKEAIADPCKHVDPNAEGGCG